MTTCIIAEKPSVARDIARIVGATTKQDGYLAGNGYLVTWAMGHLITLAMPEAYGYSNYKAEELPICPNPFQLIVRQVRKDNELEGIGANGQLFCFVVSIAVGFGHGKCNEVSHSPRDEVTVSR